jgi:hypothetical protein
VKRGFLRPNADLWSFELARVELLAGIALSGRSLRREAWVAREEVSLSRYEQLVRAEVERSDAFESRRYTRVVAVDGEGACSHCAPGFAGRAACLLCAGTGMRNNGYAGREGQFVPCKDCDNGLVPCEHCGGTHRTVHATIEYVEHRVEPWAALVLPDVSPAVARWLHERLHAALSWPDALRFSLDRMLGGGPYRGVSGEHEPEFHGFRFQGAFDRAREALRESTGRADVLRSEYVSHAIPMSCVSFRDGPREYEAIFLVDEHGQCDGYASVAP